MHPVAKGLYVTVARGAALASAIAPNAEGKIWRSLAGRRGGLARWEEWAREHRDPTRPLVWLHAPSVGEGLQGRVVLDAVRRAHPEWQLAYSFFSPSAEAFASRVNADVTGYLPFDVPTAMRRLITALDPTAIVFAKLDVWPMLCEEAVDARVPLGMVSATVSSRAKRRGRLARAVLNDGYGALDAVGAISREDADRLIELGCRREVVRVTGDTRYDQVWERAKAARRDEGVLLALGSPRPTVVAGSTWPADESVLLPAWLLLRRAVPNARLIIAPHEPTDDHVQAVEAWARNAGLGSARVDAADAGTANVVVVDRVGILGDLYALGRAAFVGGAFHKAGIHSVLEPAAYGVPVAFGPQYSRSRDAGLLLEHDGGSSVRTPTELASLLERWMTGRGDEMGANAKALVQSGLGAVEASRDLVESLVARQRS